MIQLDHVTKKYDDGTVAVSDLSMTAPTGKITMLVGPSGCGKTTTLKMINRLIEPSAGFILIDGVDAVRSDLIKMRRDIGYVIQNAGLFPNKTVIDNICTVPFLKGEKKPQAYSRAKELLNLVGLDESYAKRYPWQLSGGQRQRVGIARALAGNPTCMLMDEPFSAVDPIVRKQLQGEFLRIQKTVAKTIVMVTHDISEALKLGDYIAVFREGGHLVQFDTPSDLLKHPNDEFVSNLLGIGRGYERLGFHTSRLDTHPIPTVPLGKAFTGIEENTWCVAVGEDLHPLGWVMADSGICDAEKISFAPILDMGAMNLKEALDAVLCSPANMAIAYDRSDQACYAIDSSTVLSQITETF